METNSTPTNEQIAHIRRLEAIFSPIAHRLRNAKRENDNPNSEIGPHNRGYFAHYTSADAGLQIIKTKRLWMRSTTCMADYREVNHGYDLLFKYFGEKGKRETFFAATDSVKPGSGQAALSTFDQWWSNIRTNTYIASVSDHTIHRENDIGRLSMWRAFGAGQPRVALIFSVPWFSNLAVSLGLMFSPVLYLSEPMAQQILDAVVANIEREGEFLKSITETEFQNLVFQMLVSVVCCTKHEGFWEEREWRGVYTHGFNRKTLLERSVEVIGGVPQPVFKIPLDGSISPLLKDMDLSTTLDRVIIGPTAYSWVMYEAFVEALRSAGVPNPEQRVWNSNLPIRG